ncbi:unnamed protein product, partial [Polarella glacialis]
AQLSEAERRCFAEVAGGGSWSPEALIRSLLDEFRPGAFDSTASAACDQLFSSRPALWIATLLRSSVMAGGTEHMRWEEFPAGLRWRLCGPPGELVRRRVGTGGGGCELVCVLGLLGRALAPEEAVVRRDITWEVEFALFVTPRDSCVLVDGNRLFQTHPQSYLTAWRCS